MDALTARGLLIDGEWRAAKDDGELVVIDPSTGEVAGLAPLAGPPDADVAVGAARRAWDEGTWPSMHRRERSRRIDAFADAVEALAPDLARMSAREAGIPLGMAAAQIATGVRHVRFAAEMAGRDNAIPQGFEIGYGALGTMLTTYEPVGVVAALTPFNSPVLLTVGKLAAALAMGNTVVIKPSPLTPFEVLALGEAVQTADIPPGVVNIVTGGADVGSLLTTDERVDMISFTGSDTTGVAIARQAADGLKRVVLELGGKSAMIVRHDADLVLAAEIGAHNITLLSGQGCALLTRHLVHHSVLEEYVRLVVNVLESITVGPALGDGIMMGPLISERQRERVLGYVEVAVEQGAAVMTGGGIPEGSERGWFHQPTLLGDVENSWSVAQDEIFGPVGVVIPFKDDDEAVRIANDSRYGLAAGVISGDVVAACAVGDRLRAGQVWVNGGSPGMNPNVPWGGFKRSSIGREFGVPGILEYAELKSTLVRVR